MDKETTPRRARPWPEVRDEMRASGLIDEKRAAAARERMLAEVAAYRAAHPDDEDDEDDEDEAPASA